MHSIFMQNALMDDDYGKRLVQARQRKHLEAKDAAKALKMPYPTYKSHENGSRGGQIHAAKYARFYGVNLKWLITGKGSPVGDPITEIVEGLPPDAQNYAISFLMKLRDAHKKE
jgi:ribosome-binding protein aMBF1 (putative translation factor)